MLINSKLLCISSLWYDLLWKNIIIILPQNNIKFPAPAIFELVLSVLRPVMSPLTRQTLKVYNTNKQQWQGELLKIVEKDELPIEYGGTKEVWFKVQC